MSDRIKKVNNYISLFNKSRDGAKIYFRNSERNFSNGHTTDLTWSHLISYVVFFLCVHLLFSYALYMMQRKNSRRFTNKSSTATPVLGRAKRPVIAPNARFQGEGDAESSATGSPSWRRRTHQPTCSRKRRDDTCYLLLRAGQPRAIVFRFYAVGTPGRMRFYCGRQRRNTKIIENLENRLKVAIQ